MPDSPPPLPDGQTGGGAAATTGARGSRRAWRAYWFVVLPFVVSAFLTALLLLALLFGGVSGAVVGGLVPPLGVAAWQTRPSAQGQAEMSYGVAVGFVAGLVVVDAVVAIGVAVTGRLPLVGHVLALVLVCFHLALLVVGLLRRDRSRRAVRDG